MVFGNYKKGGLAMKRFNVNGLLLDLDEKRYIDSEILKGTFEFHSVITCLNILRPGDVFVDLGANIGWYTLLAAQKVGAQGKVLAFEPEKVAFGRLKHHVEINKGHADVVIYPCAVGARKGVATLRVKDDWGECMSSTTYTPEGSQDSYDVNVVRLDDVLGHFHIRLIKIDVEGGEYSVLLGAENLLSAGRVDYLMLEFTHTSNLETHVKINQFLTGLRYCPFNPILMNNILEDPKFLSGKIVNMFFKRV